MKSLYQIQQSYLDLLNRVETNDGLIDEELDSQLTIAKEELELKGVGYAYIIKELESYTEKADQEIKRITALKKSAERKVEIFKNKISDAMHMFGVEEIKGDLLTLNFRKSEAVEVSDDAVIPEEFKKHTFTIDKAGLKKAIKDGQAFDGIEIVKRDNLQIK